ncbi:MAG: prepilin-type N-terminal cleavage/methylation domain-containing protein [Candidatus Wolfebacteria bacterium]|nr:prepilin-type N-terminal cleavage/methylation domain-containing protein [Candidatus Wolfebacteria bacterium]
MTVIFRKKEKGQILIESMIAIGIITFGIMGVFTLLSQSLSLNRVVSDQFTASFLASEGIEVTKNLIDGNTLQGLAWNHSFTTDSCYEVDYQSVYIDVKPVDCSNSVASGDFIKYDAPTGRYGYDAGTPTSFRRKIHITPVGSDQIQVNSIVNWTTRGNASFSLNLEDRFYNWRP